MKTNLYLAFAAAAIAAVPALSQGQDISPAATPTLSPNRSVIEGFVMIDNHMHVVQNGVASPLDRDMTLRVTPNGVIGFDGVGRRITNNAMLSMDGRILPLPGGLVYAPPAPTPSDLDPRLGDRGVSGENTSGLAPSLNGSVTNGPRMVIAKKNTSKARTSSGARKSGSSTAAKKPTSRSTSSKSTASSTSTSAPAAASAPIASFPPFRDDVLPLPDATLNQEPTVSPVIDANSTMLGVTASPDSLLVPEPQSISASLRSEVEPNTTLTPAPTLQPSEVTPTPATPESPPVDGRE